MLYIYAHTQLPGGGVAIVGSFAYLVGNPRRKRLEAATAHTGERYKLLQLKAAIMEHLYYMFVVK